MSCIWVFWLQILTLSHHDTDFSTCVCVRGCLSANRSQIPASGADQRREVLISQLVRCLQRCFLSVSYVAMRLVDSSEAMDLISFKSLSGVAGSRFCLAQAAESRSAASLVSCCYCTAATNSISFVLLCCWITVWEGWRSETHQESKWSQLSCDHSEC